MYTYVCIYFPFIVRPTYDRHLLFSPCSLTEFFLHFFRIPPRPPIAPPPRFSFGFLIREPPTELELFCLLVADSVSHWKWNGIKWNVKFIVFRGFPCDKRCGTGCGSWRLKGVQRREVFSGENSRNKPKQNKTMPANRIFAYYFKCNLYAYLCCPHCSFGRSLWQFHFIGLLL